MAFRRGSFSLLMLAVLLLATSSMASNEELIQHPLLETHVDQEEPAAPESTEEAPE